MSKDFRGANYCYMYYASKSAPEYATFGRIQE